jgi:hypothetical protein
VNRDEELAIIDITSATFGEYWSRVQRLRRRDEILLANYQAHRRSPGYYREYLRARGHSDRGSTARSRISVTGRRLTAEQRKLLMLSAGGAQFRNSSGRVAAVWR